MNHIIIFYLGLIWGISTPTRSVQSERYLLLESKIGKLGGWTERGCNHLQWSLTEWFIRKQKLNFKRKRSWKLKRTKTIPKKIVSCWVAGLYFGCQCILLDDRLRRDSIVFVCFKLLLVSGLIIRYCPGCYEDDNKWSILEKIFCKLIKQRTMICYW